MNDIQVIVLGADYHGEWAKDVCIAFNDAGMKAELIYTNTLFGGMNSATSVKARASLETFKHCFRQHARFFFNFVKEVRRKMSEKALIEKIALFHAPGKKLLVLFIWTPPSESLLKKLKGQKGITLFLWQGEAPGRNVTWNASFPYFDHIFPVDEEWIPLFDGSIRERVTFLPLSSSAAKHFPLKEEEYEKFLADVAFVGYYRKERAQTLASLKNDDLKIYGYWWESGMGDFPWMKEKYHGPVSNEDANRIFNGAKIAIGTLPVPIAYGNTITQRVFDISLTGNFQVSGYTPAIPKIFGDAVPMFRDGEELKKMVDHYLAHPEERKILAAKAHAIAIKDHTYASRVKTILETLGQ